jgi:protein-tyrosine kinase
MSKIEEALKKARSQQYQELVKNDTDLDEYHYSDISLMEYDDEVDKDVLSNHRILHHEMQNHNILNEFRALRTTLLQNSKVTNPCIMVYSSSPGAGSSYVAANLAAAIALDQKRTSLLISCDIKNTPDFENLINSPNYGLVDYLSTELYAEQIIYPVGIKRVRVIPSGMSKGNFSEYFSSRRFHELLDEIKVRYRDRYIILDAPSASEEADIKLLSEFVDYGLLVVPYGRDSMDSINKASRLISKEKLLGIIINNKPNILNIFS